MSAWTKHVTEFYKSKHAKNSNYKFKQALRDARKTYKSLNKMEGKMEGGAKRRTRKNRSRKNR